MYRHIDINVWVCIHTYTYKYTSQSTYTCLRVTHMYMFLQLVNKSSQQNECNITVASRYTTAHPTHAHTHLQCMYWVSFVLQYVYTVCIEYRIHVHCMYCVWYRACSQPCKRSISHTSAMYVLSIVCMHLQCMYWLSLHISSMYVFSNVEMAARAHAYTHTHGLRACGIRFDQMPPSKIEWRYTILCDILCFCES
jgi:hypothetical protein